ncbi:MAG: 3-isopropylmalate dehydratase small subunit [Lentisphaerae bacterium]|nr:3-isopropylmalate dehydratase small subunit [Lentisphaerota bacterium]OQC14100.1 MAG: 2,3-dimethylmalate dehydratase small subunit [Lentisphaerae bacterium ADurb.Bin082]HQL88786.1 3-isopropylmalate dehydratase small subunit [Lentisphaeria bacterium]
MKITGKVIRYGDNVDTDVIIPARHLNTSDPKELAAHCMEDLDPDFVKKVQPGDIIVAGKNFGCGSSREHAPIAIKASGIACVVAKSFARIFYRNAINTGLAIVEYDGDIRDGDQLDIDFAHGVIRNHRDNTQGRFTPFPEFLQKIITAGGLFKAKETMQ